MGKNNGYHKPLWVNRTLIFEETESENSEEFIKEWLCVDDHELNYAKSELKTNGVYLGWGHNVVKVKDEKGTISDAFATLSLCQYFNSVLEFTSNELSILVGETHGRKKKKQLLKKKKTDRRLKEFVDTVNILLIQLNETQLNLQGNRRKLFQYLLEKWEIDMLTSNLRSKIDICKEKIDQIHREETKKNQIVTESILLGIGGVALIDFLANISQFAKNIIANPEMGSIDDDVVGLMNLGMEMSPNSMIWSGIVVVFIIILMFNVFQTRSR